MELFDIVAAIILFLIMIPLFFIMFRNHRVAKFRRQIIQEDYDESMYNLARGYLKEVDNYSKLPSYSRMLFSFKPLTKKHWL